MPDVLVASPCPQCALGKDNTGCYSLLLLRVSRIKRQETSLQLYMVFSLVNYTRSRRIANAAAGQMFSIIRVSGERRTVEHPLITNKEDKIINNA